MKMEKFLPNIITSLRHSKRHFWWCQIWQHLHIMMLQCWA